MPGRRQASTALRSSAPAFNNSAHYRAIIARSDRVFAEAGARAFITRAPSSRDATSQASAGAGKVDRGHTFQSSQETQDDKISALIAEGIVARDFASSAVSRRPTPSLPVRGPASTSRWRDIGWEGKSTSSELPEVARNSTAARRRSSTLPTLQFTNVAPAERDVSPRSRRLRSRSSIESLGQLVGETVRATSTSLFESVTSPRSDMSFSLPRVGSWIADAMSAFPSSLDESPGYSGLEPMVIDLFRSNAASTDDEDGGIGLASSRRAVPRGVSETSIAHQSTVHGPDGSTDQTEVAVSPRERENRTSVTSITKSRTSVDYSDDELYSVSPPSRNASTSTRQTSIESLNPVAEETKLKDTQVSKPTPHVLEQTIDDKQNAGTDHTNPVEAGTEQMSEDAHRKPLKSALKSPGNPKRRRTVSLPETGDHTT